jgi:hypothetical protein
LKARTREGAELLASLLITNVEAPPEPRLPLTVADVAFVAGVVLAMVGALLLICWRPV